jgi:undecaprenyl-diphosphatase
MQAWDVGLQRAVNQGCARPALDWVMSAVSDPLMMAPAGLLLALWLGRLLTAERALVILGVAALLLFVTESVVSSPLKAAVGRPRPHESLAGTRRVEWQRELWQPRVRVTRPDRLKARGASFPSSHVMNNVSLTVALWWGTRRRGLLVVMAAWSGLMMVSRVYVGAHHPSDVLGSAVLALGYASLVCWAVGWGIRRWLPGRAANLLAAPPGDS